jgi:hypothetical protein
MSGRVTPYKDRLDRSYVLPDAGLAVDLLTMPATVGELWMVGYLCLRGVRRT